MYLLLLVLPLFGSILSGLFARYLGRKGGCVVTTLFLFLSFAISCFVFYEVAVCGTVCWFKLADWFSSELFDASWGFYFDSLTATMLIVITAISSLVHLYSIAYMWEDPHLNRFMSYLSIFTFFMLMLVTADNLVQMFFGWEGVGVSSYLLINFWFTRLQANKSSIKAMLVNRVGDFGLAIGIFIVFSVFKTVSFPVIFAAAPYAADKTFVLFHESFHALTLMAVFLFIGAVGKSAQLGLHTWLPDAMEGPTPVSALIHAATMVTAGVFLLARCSPLFEYAPDALRLVTIIGASTCLFAATTALVQNDLKRVIAYSTASQLGYMVFACGVSNYPVAVFHLFNHAFFKALLFLGAGSVIHALANQQDMRKMGGAAALLPFTCAMMIIGSFSLAGFPFLTGFYSKDAILEITSQHYTVNAQFAYWLGSLCVFLTAYYSFRLLFLTFFGENKSPIATVRNQHDADLTTAIPLVLLAIASIFVGYLCKDMMIGVGTDFWGNALFQLSENNRLVESEFMPQSLKLFPLFASVSGIILAFLTCCCNPGLQTIAIKQLVYQSKRSAFAQKLYYMLNKRWFFDRVYNEFCSQKALDFGYHVAFKRLDKGCLEMIGVRGISTVFLQSARNMSGLQTGLLYHYALVMVIGLTLFLATQTYLDVLDRFLEQRVSVLFLIVVLFSLFNNNKQFR